MSQSPQNRPAEAARIQNGQAGQSASLPASQLPWHQIPSFDPQTTDIQVYARKLQFLKSIWPSEHISQLAPRAALQVEGVAFQKVARLDGHRLRGEDGVQFLVEALGGQWGKLASEEKLALFEKAFYQTIQKADESNDSYLARHDVAFEDLMAQKVSMEEVRAYILLRQSQLSSEDRKRIIMESKGELGYDEARRALRLLGARFFQELQGVSKNVKTKTYDINATEQASEETAMIAGEVEAFDEETAFQALYENGDEDAIFINDFEESLIETVQESAELASCFTTYLEARTRLKERARGRGFWPMQQLGAKGKGKKGKQGKGKTKSLADRIASSACRRCGQYGHWKRECPLGQSRTELKPKNQAETISIAEALHLQEDELSAAMNEIPELIFELPEAHSDLGQKDPKHLKSFDLNLGNTMCHEHAQCGDVFFGEVGCGRPQGDLVKSRGVGSGSSVLLHDRGFSKFQVLNPRMLQQCCRKHGRLTSNSPTDAAPATKALERNLSAEPDPFSPYSAFVLSEENAGEAVIDTGASRTVIGGERVSDLIAAISSSLQTPVKKVPSAVNFRFGNSGTLQSQYALCIPRRQKGWIRVEVVPGRTPFLVSNSILKELGVLIDPRNKVLRFLDNPQTISLKTCRRNLLCVSVVELLKVGDMNTTSHDMEEIYQQELGKCVGAVKTSSDCPLQEFKQQRHDFLVQEPLQNKKSFHIHTAMCSAQTDWPSVISVTSDAQDGQEHQHLPEQQQCVPGSTSLRGRGSRLTNAENLHELSKPDLQRSAGHSKSPAVGPTGDSLRQKPGEELQPCVRDGQELCVPSAQQKGSLLVAAQLSELHAGPGEIRAEVPDSDSSHDGTISGITGTTGNHHSAEGRGQGSPKSSCPAGELRGLAYDQRCGDQAEGEGKTTQRADQHCHLFDDANRAQPRSSEGIADKDCSAPKRVGPRNSGAIRRGGKSTSQLISEDQLRMLRQQMDVLVNDIEGNLEQMKRKHPSIGRPSTKTEKLIQSRPVDLLEIYCESNSQLTNQVNRFGGCAIRFTVQDGDLRTSEGINKLWTWVHLYEPKNIWVAPECKFWGSFSRFNMGRSYASQQRILQGRQDDCVHLELCNQLYLHQVAAGRHFHLEQPMGSEMVNQPQLEDVHLGTLPAFFDMCQAGKLKAPNVDRFLKKRMQVLTTSRIVHQQLHNVNCAKTHDHQQIKGNVKDPQQGWIKLSAYAAAYTAVFARRVAKGMMMSGYCHEDPLLLEELLVGEEVSQKGEKRQMAQEVLELRKVRRRYDTKSPPVPGELEPHSPQWQVFWKAVFVAFDKEVPRVGNAYFQASDPRVQKIQQQFPQVDIRFVLMCRGTEKYRVPKPEIARDDIPLRKTLVVDRQTGEIRDLGDFEEWQLFSKAKQVRKAEPARISMSVFGRRQVMEGSSGSRVFPSIESDAPMEPQFQRDLMVPSSMDDSAKTRIDRSGEQQLEESVNVPISGWPPKIIPVHGPAFRSLSAEQRADLKRLHQNLGHPDPARLQRLLTDQGANPAVIAGALDMQCDVCLETLRKPKLSHPSTIHGDLDFNDVVGADGVYWKSKLGQTYHFMHFIDESTLFHVGAPSGRTVEEQIRTFEDTWLHWAGPCKTLYLDPAGEYVNSKWNDYLQKENIKVVMAAGDSHWQIGRTEIHGRIIKDMLTRMDQEVPVRDAEDFKRCLRQAFSAKNSLSRASGFTPEQALLGKARALPASLTSDDSTGAHLLAESSTTEGLMFRESLQRREQARKAFIQADNDSSCRRALLRRSRPGSIEFETGDWVLYWKRARGNLRHERGRWYGPAQVITVERNKVIWLCHGGYLIRASPQHLRPASMREYMTLPRNASGEVKDEEISSRARNFVDLEEMPTEEDQEYEPSIAPTPPMEIDSEQPEDEASPPESLMDEGNPEMDERESPLVPGDLGGLSIPVPMDDDDDDDMEGTDDGLAVFGEDCQSPLLDSGVWEVSFQESFDLSTDTDVTDGQLAECILIATAAKKQRVEVKWRNLSDSDKSLFAQAKNKEVSAWISHGTVKKLAKGTLPENRIMRCRWILTWKDPLPGTSEKRAKARLVILGFEDPDISSVPNDAPTLSKDGKQLLLQKVASSKWRLLNFDVSTAFLKGAGDGRTLGIHAPPEIAAALKLKGDEQCGLVGGAYGRIDAPYLWYQSFRQTLEELGFLTCPLDGCVFTLVTKSTSGKPRVHGVLGIHVDDGIGGGDDFFMETIGRLRDKYSFGAFNIGEFDFCGIHYSQWRDGSIEMSQRKYIERIEPIQIDRHRRKEVQSPVTEVERQCLRQLCGSLQYAAVQTRPDISAKVGILQSMIPKACIEDLLEANRVLFEAKKNPVNLVIVPIEESKVSFCAFSDASFETKKGVASRQGTIIFTTDSNMAQNQLSVICPIAWSSRKIPRVVRSTLSAEASALSGSLDCLSWLRILWAWLLDPSINWTDPTEVLSSCPLASIATDCKSVYDLSTKTSTPVCEEFRTTLECLLIRERLTENCRLRWVCSQAMLADCLTKAMDSGTLRRAIALGKYSLFDELDILKQRAAKKDCVGYQNKNLGSLAKAWIS